MATALRLCSNGSGLANRLVILCVKPAVRSGGGGAFRHLCTQSSNEIRQVAKREMEQFWEKNRKLRRPWSPHLTIYGTSITMLTSLIHRVSGIAMGIAWPIVGAAGFFAAGSWDKIVEYARTAQLGYPIVFGVKAVICFLPVYHLVNGIRHLTYDLGMGFDLAVTKKTGVLVIALATVLTLLLASVRLQPQAGKPGQRK